MDLTIDVENYKLNIRAAGVIIHNEKVLVHRNINSDHYALIGGRVGIGESSADTVKREIEEELDTEIAVHNKIGTIEYDYPTFHLSMDCFWCTVVSGELVLKEAEAARWQTKDELDSVQWIPADRTILKQIQKAMQ